MKYEINGKRKKGTISPMIYGHFIEHFHRQIYEGIYEPGNPLSDENGLRRDVIEALRKIKVPILRWPGGCFVSSYHWKEGVGKERIPSYDKAWMVEEPNTFGTDEFMDFCEKVGCEPYICTNAGTGTAEEMSDWVEYCNLEKEGRYAKWRIGNGHEKPYNVKYWSIGNENYGSWELGAKKAQEWGQLVAESAKLMRRVDSDLELSAAALTDVDWNMNLLKESGQYLDWISIHSYWDAVHVVNDLADYDAVMAYTNALEDSVKKVRGLLTALGLEKKIKIAYDEWNLRGWHHPAIHSNKKGMTKEEYLYPRDKNDDNSQYTMADAVFSACFLNMCGRNCDIVGMANFAPVVNTRGCIFTHRDGIVLRSTYHVFDLYVNYLGDIALDGWTSDENTMQVCAKDKTVCDTEVLDILPTWDSQRQHYALAVVNKSADTSQKLELDLINDSIREYRVITVNGDNTDSYNDIGQNEVELTEGKWQPVTGAVELAPHSVNVIWLR